MTAATRKRIDKSVLTHGIPKRVVDLAYRRQVQGKPCDVWGCTHDPATVVGAHYTVPLPGLPKGRGLKQHDGTLLNLCFHHHEVLDGRRKVTPRQLADLKDSIIVGLIMRDNGSQPEDFHDRMPVPAEVMEHVRDKLILFFTMRRYFAYDTRNKS